MVTDHNYLDSLVHGPNSKWFLTGGVVVAVLVVWEYRKTRVLNASATSVTDSTATTDGTDSSVPDYSSDTAGLFGYTDPSTGTVITGGSAQTLLGPTTNAQWAQQVSAILTQGGYDQTTVQAALGHYLLGTQMSSQQWEIVQAGIALEGQPPQGAPAPHVAPTSSGPTTNTATPTDGYYVQIPNGYHYQVQAGKRYQLTAPTVAKLTQQGVRFKTTLSNNPIYKLPAGSPYRI
jgi:hypothetical protein